MKERATRQSKTFSCQEPREIDIFPLANSSMDALPSADADKYRRLRRRDIFILQ